MKTFDKRHNKNKEFDIITLKKKNLFITNKRRKQKRKYLFAIAASVASVLVVAGVIVCFYSLTCVKGIDVFQNKNVAAQAVSSKAPEKSSAALSSSKAQSSSASSVTVSSTNSKNLKVNSNGYFDDAVFMGDSLTCDINMIDGYIGKATVVGSSGVSCYRALNDHNCIINEKKKDKAYMPDRVRAANPKKVYMMFGLNDLCWGEQMTESMFVKNYSKLVDIIKGDCPGASIYIQSIMPITAAMENSKSTPFTNKRVETFNNHLKKIAAEKGAKYLDVASIVRGADGKLQKGVSDDGIHLHADKYKLWMNYLLNNK